MIIVNILEWLHLLLIYGARYGAVSKTSDTDNLFPYASRHSRFVYNKQSMRALPVPVLQLWHAALHLLPDNPDL